MSTQQSCHHLYDALFLWPKPVGYAPDLFPSYTLCLSTGFATHVSCVRSLARSEERNEDIVIFFTTSGFPLYPVILALFCEVAWMSGATEYIMDMERSMEQTRVLAMTV